MLIQLNTITNPLKMPYRHIETKPFSELNSHEFKCVNHCAQIALNSDAPENQMKLGAMLLCQKGFY